MNIRFDLFDVCVCLCVRCARVCMRECVCVRSVRAAGMCVCCVCVSACVCV